MTPFEKLLKQARSPWRHPVDAWHRWKARPGIEMEPVDIAAMMVLMSEEMDNQGRWRSGKQTYINVPEEQLKAELGDTYKPVKLVPVAEPTLQPKLKIDDPCPRCQGYVRWYKRTPLKVFRHYLYHLGWKHPRAKKKD